MKRTVLWIALLALAASAQGAAGSGALPVEIHQEGCVEVETGPRLCVPCHDQIPPAVVGYVETLTSANLPGVVWDDYYDAYGVFEDRPAEKDPETGQVLFFKYKILSGFSSRADRCYGWEEFNLLAH